VLSEERTGVPSPVGLAFSPATRAFYVVGTPPGAIPDTEVVKLSPFDLSSVSDRSGSTRIAAAIENPINMAFDARRGRLLLLGHTRQLLEVQTAGGDLDRQSLNRHDATRFGLNDPQGMAVDPASGTVYILDAALPRIVSIEPAADGSLDTAATSEIDLRPAGLRNVHGLAFDPSTGHLHLASGRTLVELMTNGAVVARRDLSGVALAKPEGMVFAPSGDQTDAASQLSLYVADSGTSASLGQIMELSLSEQVSTAAIDFTSQLIRTVNMGALNPPSPDPSGITYVPAGNKLVISDGEVEETVNGITHFEGANVWELTRSGSIIRTANISKVEPTDVPMTNEPVGVTRKPSNGHYFVSEDGGKKVYDLNPGADGDIGTADDSWTFFKTNIAPNDNGDPEGIAYDTANDRLFVADGVNREIYQYTTTGTVIGHFDVQQYGVEDPETVEYNSDTGTLFVLSNRQSGPIVVETTTSGALVQTIDVAASGAFKPAGLAYAPASNGSGAKRFYIIDRGIDNNRDPNIVDGKMYEMTTPGAPPPPSGSLYFSLLNAGTVGGVSAQDEDVVFFDATNFSLAFDGSDVGIAGFRIDAFSWVDANELLLSFDQPGTVPGIAGTTDDSDVVLFTATSLGSVTAGAFSMYFDGSDVGLTSSTEDVDAVERLPNGDILLSTNGAVSVTGVSAEDEDLLRFVPTSLGAVTAGSFSVYFDGTGVGLTNLGEDIDAAAVDASGKIYLSTVANFSVTGISGADEDIFVFTPPGTFSSILYFDGSVHGLGPNDVSAADLP
jgi:uncharacterized protein YjiK